MPARPARSGPSRPEWSTVGSDADTRWPTRAGQPGPVQPGGARPGEPWPAQARPRDARAAALALETDLRGRVAVQAPSEIDLGEPPIGSAPRGKPAKEGKRSRAAKRAAKQNDRQGVLAAGERAGAARAAMPTREPAAARETAATRQAVMTRESVVTREAPVVRDTVLEKAPAPRKTRADRAKRKGPRRSLFAHPFVLVGATCVVAAGAAAGYVMHKGATPHRVSTPQRLMGYVQDPALASGMGLSHLRDDIVKKSNGEASHVVGAVYEQGTGPAAKNGPMIILFIGGNLSGSAGSFVSSFTGLLPGAFVASPGSLGGQAACVPGHAGHPAECAWADNDTFGLISSPTLSAAALGRELRTIRPLVEHVAK